MIFDLHNHTIRSYDGFTTQNEIIAACKINNINAIAITEHDVLCNLSKEIFIRNNIELIHGCEYTCEYGSHIIGLFVNESLPYGMTRHKIADHIKKQEGVIIIPHPFKPDSGYFNYYKEDDFLDTVDCLEYINGGWNSKNYTSEIIRIAEKYQMLMISSSDSHKACQVGLCATSIKLSQNFKAGEFKNILKNASQGDLNLLMDSKLLDKKGRKIYKIQKTLSYQFILRYIPKFIRRYIKLIRYKFSNQKKPTKVKYKKVSIS